MSNKNNIVRREVVESIRAVEEANKVTPKTTEQTHSYSVGEYASSVSNRLSPDTLILIAKMKKEFFG
jgi:hypothetical protein